LPHYPRLITMLRLEPGRLNAACEIFLTDLEASTLRACDFPTAAPGWWKVQLPRSVVQSHGLPACLAEGHTPPHTVPDVLLIREPAPVEAAGSPPPQSTPISTRRSYRDLGPAPETARLRCWLVNNAPQTSGGSCTPSSHGQRIVSRSDPSSSGYIGWERDG
jgi:hypothetical protein